MTTMRTFFFGLLASVLVWGVPATSLAQSGSTNPAGTPGSTNAGTGAGLINPLKVDSFDGLLRAILNGVIEIGTIVLILMLVYVGFMFVMARGNPTELQKAKSALLWTVIGGLVLLGATAIQVVISGTVESIRI